MPNVHHMATNPIVKHQVTSHVAGPGDSTPSALTPPLLSLPSALCASSPFPPTPPRPSTPLSRTGSISGGTGGGAPTPTAGPKPSSMGVPGPVLVAALSHSA